MLVTQSPQRTPSADDRRLSTLVRSLLHQSQYLALRSVQVEMTGEHLVLRGRVPSYYLKQVAQTQAGQSGAQVVNEIEVM